MYKFLRYCVGKKLFIKCVKHLRLLNYKHDNINKSTFFLGTDSKLFIYSFHFRCLHFLNELLAMTGGFEKNLLCQKLI